jgi:hypothetical protein
LAIQAVSRRIQESIMDFNFAFDQEISRGNLSGRQLKISSYGEYTVDDGKGILNSKIFYKT